MKLARSLLSGLVTIWLAASTAFLLMRAVPGDAIRATLQQSGAPPAVIEQRRAALGLDLPLMAQYTAMLTDALRGQMGVSLVSGQPVVALISAAVPATLSLAFAAIVVAVPCSLLLGVTAGTDGRWSRAARATIALLMAAPAYWLGFLLLFLASVTLGFVAQGIALPALALGLSVSGSLGRVIEGSMRTQAQAGYIPAARARGLTERVLIWRHMLRAALPPVLSAVGLQAAFLAGGVVITEMVFSRPGLGRVLTDAALRGDYPVVQGVILWSVTAVVLMQLVADAASAAADPRVRHVA